MYWVQARYGVAMPQRDAGTSALGLDPYMLQADSVSADHLDEKEVMRNMMFNDWW